MQAEGLFGRDTELSTVESWLVQAAEGGSALVIEGEPGIGKTTLWREAIRRAEESGFAILLSRPAEAEVQLSFSGLTDLLEPVPEDVFASLPTPQCDALETAVLRAETPGSPAEPRAVSAGLRGVLIGLAARSPVLVAVDDAQWLDAASAGALAFALRRLEGERVGVLATRRPRVAGVDQVAIPAAEVVELQPLRLAAVHEILKGRLGRSLPRPLLVRICETCRGNPFYALEIAREVIRSGVGPGDPLPAPKDLRRLVRRRLARFPAPVRETLLVAAALTEPTRAALAAAIGEETAAALEEAEAAEVLELEGEVIRFAHPLYAAAVYASASAEQLGRLHRRLSEVVEDVEERARHLALGTHAPSEAVAASLDDAAGLALRRGATRAAAQLTELALERTLADDDEGREKRTLDLADRLMLAADSVRAREVLRASLPTLRSREARVHALLALSELAMWSSAPDWSVAEEHPVVLAERALEAAGDDPSLAVRTHTALAVVLESDSEAALGHARRALELIEREAQVLPAVHALALSSLTRSKLFRGDGLDITSMEQAIELERTAPPRLVHDRSSFKLAQWLKYVDDFERSRRGLEHARQAALDEGDDFSLVNILINLVILECWAGRWADARSLGAELEQRFVELGWEEPPTPHVALVAALAGDVETVRELEGTGPWTGVYEVIRLRPLGLLALAAGDPEAARSYYLRALQVMEESGMREPAVFRVHGDTIESVVRSGDTETAQRLEHEFSAHAARSSIPWNRAIAARCRALLRAGEADLAAALDDIDVALREHERLPMPFELGRTLLVKGEIERRAKQKAAAKASLDRSLGIFDELGSPVWADRARRELERLGVRRPAADLTETEERVARLAASGLTNREVAAQLFVSPKTVEAHLARAYRKLGIHSRAELGARFADVVPTETEL